MRIAVSLLMMVLILTACGSNDNLPTEVGLPAPTKTLIPTQAQSLTTPTLPDSTLSASDDTPTDDADAQAVTQTSPTLANDSSTDTPVDCNVQDGWFEYTVQRGDNLASIANRSGSTIDELTVANCLENPNRINPGQVLVVPNDLSLPTNTAIPTAVPTSNTTTSVPAQVTTSAPSSRTPSVSASLKKTYEHEKGFGFDYPLDWFITESQTSTVDNILITSFEYTAGVEIPQNRWSDDMVSMTVTVFNDPATQTLSQWTQSVQNQFQNAANVSEVFLPVRVTTDGGIDGQAIDYVTNDDTVIRNYYFIIDETQVQINVGGNLDLAETVVDSLSLTNRD